MPHCVAVLVFCGDDGLRWAQWRLAYAVDKCVALATFALAICGIADCGGIAGDFAAEVIGATIETVAEVSIITHTFPATVPVCIFSTFDWDYQWGEGWNY